MSVGVASACPRPGMSTPDSPMQVCPARNRRPTVTPVRAKVCTNVALDGRPCCALVRIGGIEQQRSKYLRPSSHGDGPPRARLATHTCAWKDSILAITSGSTNHDTERRDHH